jgi:PPP family 3-phenylpropionic acid transporter
VITAEPRDPNAVSAVTASGANVSTPWTLRAIYAAVGLSTASLAPFVPVILKSRGLDPAAIGVVAAAGALLATLVVPAWDHLADVIVGRARAFRIGLVIASGSAIGLLLNLPILVVAALLATFTVFATLFIGLTDALAIADLPAPERQYGALRAHASLSFTVGIVVVGFVYSWAGYGAAPVVFLIWAAALLFLVGRIPDRSRDVRYRMVADGGGAARGARLGSVGRAFEVQPRLWLVLAVFAFAFAGLQGSLTFIGIRIVELGGQPSDVALSFGVAAVAEIPGLVAAGWLGRRFGLRWTLVASLILYGLAIATWGILPSAVAINATRAVTGLCNGSLMASRVLIVPRLLPQSLLATGQVMFQAATIGLGAVIGSVIGGVAYSALGPTAFFASAGAIAIIGAVGAWYVLAGDVGGRLTGRTEDPVKLADASTLIKVGEFS